MIEEQIEQDLKSAMLARDTNTVSTLRVVKSVFLYSKVAAGTRDSKLSDEEATKILLREAKKRQESADLYLKGGENARAEQELGEKKLIEAYLPEKLSEDKLVDIIDKVMFAKPEANMGQIISEVKNQTAGKAGGADIARIVKAKLEQ